MATGTCGVLYRRSGDEEVRAPADGVVGLAPVRKRGGSRVGRRSGLLLLRWPAAMAPCEEQRDGESDSERERTAGKEEKEGTAWLGEMEAHGRR